MKIQKFLFTTMLCGVFGVFTACSDDLDPVTGDAEVTNPVEEELETVLMLSTGLGNSSISTKSEDEPINKESINTDSQGNLKYDVDLNTASNFVIALFNVNNKNTPTTLIDLKSIDSPIPEEDGSYLIPPFKFKIKPSITTTEGEITKSYGKVAVVVLGNTTHGGMKLEKFEGNNFKSFVDFTKELSVNPGVSYIFWDGSIDATEQGNFVNKYPLSSNVYVFQVEAGAVNGVGVNKNDAIEIVNKTFSTSTTNYNEVTNSSINLYRTIAEVELKSLKFEDYSDDMKFHHFVLEEIFVMNVPKTIKWFNSDLPTEGISNLSWGGGLNLPYPFQLAKDGALAEDGAFANKFFLAGNDWKDDSASNSLIKGEAGKYCNDDILSSTQKKAPGLRFVNYSENMRGNEYTKYKSTDQYNPYYGAFYTKDDNDMRMSCTPEKANNNTWPQIKFAVSPSNYAKEGYDKALCLVVKGRYYYQTSNGQVVGSDLSLSKDPYASKYYTVVVNSSEDQYSGNKQDHSDEVRRNYRYQISLTISGPGSDTPWDYTKNSYVVPKVRIVPFGLVEQNSKLD